jgi:ribosomal protein S18 acetylase RimI-like enzyme
VTLPGLPPHLTDDAGFELRAAVYANQRTWVRRVGAIDAAGRRRPIFDRGGVLAVRTGTTAAIVLPDLPGAIPHDLPAALAWLRHEGSGDALVWAAAPEHETDRWLAAHGARESFSPTWMTRPADLDPGDASDGLATVRRAREADLPLLLTARELPYHSEWQARATLRLSTTLAPDDVALVVALAGGEMAGRGVISHAQTAARATAGVYDVGVAPRWQRKGVGRQIVAALLGIAREWEADLVTLNATPAGIALYRSLGFADAGAGQTWLLPSDTLCHPPGEEEVHFALAISGGAALPAAPSLARRLLPNGDTPLAHAARFASVASARRLLAMGTIPDLAALWRLGLRAQARALMRDREALDARRGPQQATPLHIAVYWDDLAFLEALLDAGADPSIRDGVFGSDARGWCHALGREEALALLDSRFAEEPEARAGRDPAQPP